MKRLIYLVYYLKNLDRSKFLKFLNYINTQKGIPRLKLLFDIFFSSLRYNISLLEYFQFRFYELNHKERKMWAGTGYMYEYQKIMNPLKQRIILDDKTLFFREYGLLIKHKVTDITELKEDPLILEPILANKAGKIVFKIAHGKCGANITIRQSDDFKSTDVSAFMKEHGFDIVEEYIIQHQDFMKLSPSAVNTIRIFTQLNAVNEVEILGCRLRISVNSSVDNMAAGNMAAPIDEHTGVITGPAVYSDITRQEEFMHPVTGVNIVGFIIPFWEQTLSMVKTAALLHPQNLSVGWDIAMTDTGPDLIEGNHDWCKLVWQLPVKKGLKPVLERYLAEYKAGRKSI
jgi:hypothetical protein